MSTAGGPDGAGTGAPPALAAGTHGDLGVTVARDLSGAGRLARGGHTRFSTLRLTSAGAPAARAADGALPFPSPANGGPAAGAPPGPPPARASPLRRLLGWLGLGRGPGRGA